VSDHEQTPVQDRLRSPSRLSAEYPEGTIIADSYRIEQKLGGGGMGTVYKCTDLAMSRCVAVKFLHPHLVATDKWLLRFQQEARAVGRLKHPNIISVHMFSKHGETPFIVMDYVQGRGLDAILEKEGTLPTERALKIMAQVADGLAHAHELGVIHRDLKPSNILILDGTDDVVRILDFGIAKLEDGGDTLNGPKLTQTGEVFGSPAYMSPEQSTGRHIDGRSDQYSFGCVLYECLTGSVPFVAASFVEVMMKQAGEKPHTLAEASLGKRFPEHLEATVAKTLEKEPAKRFDSMPAVKEAMMGRVPVPETAPVATRGKDSSNFHWALPVVAVLVVAAVLAIMLRNMYGPVQLQRSDDNNHSARGSSSNKDNVDAENAKLALSNWVSKHRNATAFDAVTAIGEGAVSRLPNSALGALDAMPNLADVNLGKCAEIDDDGVKEIASNHPGIWRIGLSQTIISGKSLRYLAPLTQLTAVDLGGTQIRDEDVQLLLPLKELSTLNLSDCPYLSPRVLETVGKMTSLTILSLNKNQNLGGGLRSLAGLKKLRILGLDDIQARDGDIQDVSNITSLTQFSVARGNFTNQVIPYLAKLHNLAYLGLDNCRMIGSATGALRPLTSLNLKTLRITGTAVSDADAELISQMQTIDALNIAKTKLTERGVTALSKLKKIRYLELNRNLENSSALKEFRNSHPKCKIDFVRDAPPVEQDIEFEKDVEKRLSR